MCAVIAVGIPYGAMVIQGTRLGLSSCTPAAFFLLFVLLLTVQVLLGTMRRTWALTRAELVTVFIMMAVATAIPTRGVTGMLLPMITGTFYYATPENEWTTLIHPLLSDWMVVYHPTAVKEFYEGTTSGSGIPLDVWAPPLLRWFSFFAGFWLVLVCAMVILRRPWVEHERLVFPLAQLSLAMIEDRRGDRGEILKPFFKSPVMWCGLAIPLVLGSVNALSHYLHFISPINPAASVPLFRDSVVRAAAHQLPDVRLRLLHQLRDRLQPLVLLPPQHPAGGRVLHRRHPQRRGTGPVDRLRGRWEPSWDTR